MRPPLSPVQKCRGFTVSPVIARRPQEGATRLPRSHVPVEASRPQTSSSTKATKDDVTLPSPPPSRIVPARWRSCRSTYSSRGAGTSRARVASLVPSSRSPPWRSRSHPGRPSACPGAALRSHAFAPHPGPDPLVHVGYAPGLTAACRTPPRECPGTRTSSARRTTTSPPLSHHSIVAPGVRSEPPPDARRYRHLPLGSDLRFDSLHWLAPLPTTHPRIVHFIIRVMRLAPCAKVSSAPFRQPDFDRHGKCLGVSRHGEARGKEMLDDTGALALQLPANLLVVMATAP